MLSSCSAGKVLYLAPRPTLGQSPNLGELSTAPVGGVIYREWGYREQSGCRIDTDIKVRYALQTFLIPAPTFVPKAQVDGKLRCCTGRAVIQPIFGPSSQTTACLVDANQDGHCEQLVALSGAVWVRRDLQPPLPCEETTLPLPDDDAFRYELLYHGIGGNTLKVLYREYKGDLARPAFYQDVAYTAEVFPTTITFRNVQIEIIHADNKRIRYRVLKGF